MSKELNDIRRGDVFLADLDPIRGSEQGGTRPVLVIQNDVGNHYSPTVIVAPITSELKKHNQPTHVALPPELGLPAESMVLLEQVRTIDKSRLDTYMVSMDEDSMARVDGALGISLAIDDPTRVKLPDEMELCLCPICASQFFNSPEHIIRRVNPLCDVKADCTYCQVRKGYDYMIRRVKKKAGSTTGETDWR